jgi:DNA-directed RNA polymerase specialized sigma24 family protein
MKVTAKAVRSGDWWAIEVSGERDNLPTLHTQTRRLDHVAKWAADAAASGWEVALDDIKVEVVPVLPARESDLVEAAAMASRTAEAAARDASRRNRQAVAALRADGLTVRDVGVILGVSPQRVSQLIER